jgi:hypothetical protein
MEKKERKENVKFSIRESSLINRATMSTMQVQKTINVLLYIYIYIYVYVYICGT